MAGAPEAGGQGALRVSTRVRYPETDRMGVAYHAHYLVWFELGRTELMRELDLTYHEIEERSGIRFPVVEVGARYYNPARYDERIHVTTRLVAVGGARVRFEYRVTREADGVRLAEGFSEHASVDRSGRPVRLPAELRRKLERARITTDG
jgi:acyl-CoA thioester hydrolase